MTVVNDPYEYQQKAYEEAVKHNIFVVGETGCGKTFISVMLMEHIINQCKENNSRKRIFFLVHSVLLATQQSRVIEKHLAKRLRISVGRFVGGSSTYVKNALENESEEISVEKNGRRYKIVTRDETWKRELESTDIFVMTAQIFLAN
jgi:ERCC4-related helicase